jgi:hypothetical protein
VWSPSNFFSGLAPDNYKSSATEAVLLWIFRTLIVPSLIILGVRKSSLKRSQPQQETESKQEGSLLTDDLDADINKGSVVLNVVRGA